MELPQDSLDAGISGPAKERGGQGAPHNDRDDSAANQTEGAAPTTPITLSGEVNADLPPAVDAPVEYVSDAPDDALVEAPIDAPDDAPDDALVEAPIDAPDDAPDDALFDTADDVPIDAPDEAPVEENAMLIAEYSSELDTRAAKVSILAVNHNTPAEFNIKTDVWANEIPYDKSSGCLDRAKSATVTALVDLDYRTRELGSAFSRFFRNLAGGGEKRSHGSAFGAATNSNQGNRWSGGDGWNIGRGQEDDDDSDDDGMGRYHGAGGGGGGGGDKENEPANRRVSTMQRPTSKEAVNNLLNLGISNRLYGIARNHMRSAMSGKRFVNRTQEFLGRELLRVVSIPPTEEVGDAVREAKAYRSRLARHLELFEEKILNQPLFSFFVINLGWEPSEHTKVAFLWNWAPDNEKDHDGSDKYDKIPIKNTSIRGHLTMMVKSLLKDVGTEPSLIAGAVQYFHQVSRCIDRVPYVANDREKVNAEIREFCATLRIATDEMHLFSSISLLWDARIVRARSGGRERLVVVPVGSGVRDKAMSSLAKSNALHAVCFGVLPHGECISVGHLKIARDQYPDDLLREYTDTHVRVLHRAYSGSQFSFPASSASELSEICDGPTAYFRRAGGNMSADELAGLQEVRLRASSSGGTNNWKRVVKTVEEIERKQNADPGYKLTDEESKLLGWLKDWNTVCRWPPEKIDPNMKKMGAFQLVHGHSHPKDGHGLHELAKKYRRRMENRELKEEGKPVLSKSNKGAASEHTAQVLTRICFQKESPGNGQASAKKKREIEKKYHSGIVPNGRWWVAGADYYPYVPEHKKG